MSLPSGTCLGRYEIRSKLGAGGMGEVYLAQDTKLDRKVALKILPFEVASHRDRMGRFVREAKSAASLNHPNIAQVHEIGEHEGVHFIVMEFIDGVTLREKIHREQTELTKLLRYLQQAAEGLSKAHAAGVVHRDLKPDNIMITCDGFAKVLDFGLAKLSEPRTVGVATGSEAATRKALTNAGVVIGTVGYMSPEQAQGRTDEIDQRSDIFSFGCILFEAVTGHKAFDGKDAIDTLNKIIREPVPPISDFRSDAPNHLQRIVRRCLAKDREDRYQTIKDVAIELRELRRDLEGAGVDTTVPPARSETTADTGAEIGGGAQTGSAPGSITVPVSSVEYLVTSIKRHKLAAIIVLAALMLSGVALTAYLPARNTEVAIDSIAVLPFTNQNSDPNTEYLSDGISEALINSLTELQQLRVIARSTAFRYKGREVDPQAVGRDLNVRAVLMGRVRQAGDALNIQVDLVDATTGAQLWGKEYERKVSDVLSVKQTIAREVTEKLRLRLSGEDERRLVKRDTTNAEAYQFYLRGRYFWNKRTADGLKKSIEEFQQAIDRDPTYALGYVGLADCYLVLELYAGVPSIESLPKARAAADRALQLDGSLSEAHTSSAYIYQQMWRWAEAEQEYQRAISLNPNYATAHLWFGTYLRTKGQFDDALRETKRAQELDPLSSVPF